MSIFNLIEKYGFELAAIGIELDVAVSYTEQELSIIEDQCQSYRERKELLMRIEHLEARVNALEGIREDG